MARAPFSMTTSERTNIAVGFSEATNNRCSGRSVAAPAATRMTAPSPIRAVLSATATSLDGASLPRWPATTGSLSASACASGRIVRPASRPAVSDSSGNERAVDEGETAAFDVAEHFPCRLGNRLRRRVGRLASGLASRMSARRSVYFHSSMRRCGRPSRFKSAKRVVAQVGQRTASGQPRFGRSECLGQADFGAGLYLADFGVHGDLTPPRPDIRHSRALRVRAPIPCRRSSRCGPSTARARHPARCSREGADSA